MKRLSWLDEPTGNNGQRIHIPGQRKIIGLYLNFAFRDCYIERGVKKIMILSKV
jgi:hypothetical protein